jgi:hypothetical protein
MDVMIYTSDPDHVDPDIVRLALEQAGFFVASVNVNDGERKWEMGD